MDERSFWQAVARAGILDQTTNYYADVFLTKSLDDFIRVYWGVEGRGYTVTQDQHSYEWFPTLERAIERVAYLVR